MKDQMNNLQTAVDVLRLLDEYDLAKYTIANRSADWLSKVLKYSLHKAKVKKNHEALDLLTSIYKYI